MVGVGDMSGDVFGNGMLLSPHIKLLGAFNHQQSSSIQARSGESLAERQRLFDLPRSAWSDYDASADLEGRRSLRAQRQVDRLIARDQGGLPSSPPTG